MQRATVCFLRLVQSVIQCLFQYIAVINQTTHKIYISRKIAAGGFPSPFFFLFQNREPKRKINTLAFDKEYFSFFFGMFTFMLRNCFSLRMEKG